MAHKLEALTMIHHLALSSAKGRLRFLGLVLYEPQGFQARSRQQSQNKKQFTHLNWIIPRTFARCLELTYSTQRVQVEKLRSACPKPERSLELQLMYLLSKSTCLTWIVLHKDPSGCNTMTLHRTLHPSLLGPTILDTDCSIQKLLN